MKKPACCARLGARVVMNQAALVRYAHVVAAAQDRGEPLDRHLQKLEGLKASVRIAQEAVKEHAATHQP